MAEAKAAKKFEIPRWRVCYYDEKRSPDVLSVGAWEINMAERKFYVGCVTQGALDGITYAAFCGAKRAGIIAKDADYETWAEGVAFIEELEPGESQPQPGN